MTYSITFSASAFNDYIAWMSNKQVIRKINNLIMDIQRDPQGPGIGKPELLVGSLSGYASRRITEEHRLVYRLRNNTIEIISCYGHYGNK